MSLQNLLSLNQHLQTSNIINYSSPNTNPKRASVAAILRWKPNSTTSITSNSLATTLADFVELMNDIPGEVELLYIQRTKREGDVWSGHTALPGGKCEGDETDIDTAMREVKEEIGLELNSPDFIYMGKLDDKKIKSVTNEFMMILAPFVFLQVAPITPKLTLQPAEIYATHWVRLNYLFYTPPVNFDPFNKIVIKTDDFDYSEIDNMVVPAVVLPTNEIEPVILWGLTFRISQQLLDFAYRNEFPNNSIYINMKSKM